MGDFLKKFLNGILVFITIVLLVIVYSFLQIIFKDDTVWVVPLTLFTGAGLFIIIKIFKKN